MISNEEKPAFEVTISSVNKKAVNEMYGADFLKGIYKGYKVNRIDQNDNEAKYEITIEEE